MQKGGWVGLLGLAEEGAIALSRVTTPRVLLQNRFTHGLFNTTLGWDWVEVRV